MQHGVRFWATPKEEYNTGIYYWASNESTSNISGTIYLDNSSFVGASTHNPELDSFLTPMFLRYTSLVTDASISEIEYYWFQDNLDVLGVLFTVVFVNWVLRTGPLLSYNTTVASNITAQDRTYIKQILVNNPSLPESNIVYRNLSHRTLFLEFWNAAVSTRLYRLEIPPGTTVEDNCTVNLSTVGQIIVGSTGDSIGGRHYGISKSILGSNKVIMSGVNLPTGGGYISSGVSFSGDNSYFPLYFYSQGNSL